jgi:hypothetical protein
MDAVIVDMCRSKLKPILKRQHLQLHRLSNYERRPIASGDHHATGDVPASFGQAD